MMLCLVASIFHGWQRGTVFGLLLLCMLWPGLANSLAIHNGKVRLADGNSPNEGRVEVYYDGQWGTVCDDNWDIADAQVVCHSLGFAQATEAKTGAAYGEGRGLIVLDDVSCSGIELSLVQCSSNGWLIHNCGHGEDVGVVCAEMVFNPGRFFLDHSGGFPEDLGKLYDSQQDCDFIITVLVAGKHLDLELPSPCAHRLILHMNSEASFLLQDSNNSYALRVKEDCLPSVNSFLRYFYSRQIELTMDSVKCIHMLASANGVSGLQAYCSQLFPYFLPLNPSFHIQLEQYEYSLSSGDTGLQEIILQYLAWNCEALTYTEAWLALTPEKMEALLSRTDVVIESEWSLLKALDSWAQAKGAQAAMKGLVEKIRFPMLFPEQLFELQFNLSLYDNKDYENIFQRKILDALEFHTVPFKFLRRYNPQKFRGDAYTPRFYTGSTWSLFLNYDHLTQQYLPYHFNGSKLSHSFETPKHPSFLFKTQKISWSFTYHASSAESCQNDSFCCSSDSFPILCLVQTGGSMEDTIQYENKALLLCQWFYIVGVVDFKNGSAVVPNATSAASFPCANGYSGFVAVLRPVYKQNA